jgi:hypothetical protein
MRQLFCPQNYSRFRVVFSKPVASCNKKVPQGLKPSFYPLFGTTEVVP